MVSPDSPADLPVSKELEKFSQWHKELLHPETRARQKQ